MLFYRSHPSSKQENGSIEKVVFLQSSNPTYYYEIYLVNNTYQCLFEAIAKELCKLFEF